MLQERIGHGFWLYEVEHEQLMGAQREMAFSAVVAGEPLPFGFEHVYSVKGGTSAWRGKLVH